MRNNDAAVCDIGSYLAESPSDVFVRKAVEAVPADTLVVERFGNGVAVGNLRMAAMKCRVEAGNLKHMRLVLHYCLDGCQIVRLMYGCKGNEALEPFDDVAGDDGRRTVVRAAMDDAMPNRNRQFPAN